MKKYFTTKNGQTIELVEANQSDFEAILKFVNQLAKENSFLSFNPGHEITREEEQKWLSNTLESMKNKAAKVYWARFGSEIVGCVDVHRGSSVRQWHIGTIGLMVRKDFRGQGLGKFLLQFIIDQAKIEGIRTVKLDCFADNTVALNLYLKMGFVEYGRLPEGVWRKNKFSDLISLSQQIN